MASWSYFHNLDPFLISFTQNFGLRWYSLAYIAGVLLGYLFVIQMVKKSRTPLSSSDISSLVNYIILGVILGGRIGYCLAYQPYLLTSFSGQFPFWGLLEIHKGGMASHGGILGLILAAFLFSRSKKVSTFHVLDLTVVGGGLGIVLGRIANFINGELYGRIVEGKVFFGVQFPSEIYSWYTQLDKVRLESLKTVVAKLGSIPSSFGNNSLTLTENLWLSWMKSSHKYGTEILSTLNHITDSVEKSNMEVIEALKTVLPIRHPSQLYQSFLEGLIPLIIVFILWIKPRKAGVISGAWGISYLLMRIVGEIFRNPDSHIGFDLWGLTRGQWLSLALIIPTMIYCFFVYKSHERNRY